MLPEPTVRIVAEASEPSAEALQLCEDGAFRVGHFCAWSGVGRTVAYAEMSAGRLSWIRAGRVRLIPRRAATRWLAERMNP